MAVLPDNVGGGNGILGGRFAERRPRIAAFLNDRSNALTQFGLGLLSGSNRQEAWGNAAQGLAYGRQADQAGRDRRTEDEEKARQDEAINNLLMSPEFASLPEEYRTMLTNDRELARSFLASDLTRRTTPAPAPTPTDDIREYEFAKTQGFAGSFQEWQMQRPPTTVINNGSNGIEYGTAPTGYAWAHNPDGTVKIDERGAPVALPVGPALAAQQATETASANAAARTDTTAGIVLEDIDKAIDGAGAWTTGLLGRLTVGVPGTPAYDLARTVDTIKANIGFDQLQAMRAASPTGGALGAVSDSENRMLQSVLGNLETSQSPTQFQENLTRLKTLYLNIVHGEGNWTIGTDGQVQVGGQTAAPAASPAAAGGIAEGATATNPATGERIVYRGGQWVPM